jgi:signal transduction histidine kinase
MRERERAETELRGQREQLAALSRRLIEAQEAERRSIARELHDDFGQVLTALRLNLQKNGADPRESIELVDQAIGRMRDLALDLRPAILDDLGLAPALRWYGAREAQRAGLDFRLSIAELDERLPPPVEITCFRLVQEALTNVVRHAQARSVTVTLTTVPDEVRLDVSDDGQGFELAEAHRRAAAGKSQGLIGMQERVSLAGGELAIDAAPGRGTTIRARFPRSGRGGM